MTWRHWSTPARLVLSALFLVGLIAYNPAGLVGRLSSVRLLELTLALILAFPLIAVKAARWRVLLADMGQRVTLASSTIAYAVGMGAGALTPGQVGDFGKAWFVRLQGIPLRYGIVASLIDRLFDAALLLLMLAWVSLVWGTGGSLWVTVALLVAMVGAGSTLVRGPVQKRLAKFAVVAASRWGWLGGLASLHAEAGPLAIGPGAFLRAFLLTIAAYVIAVLRIELLVQSLGEALDLVQTLTVATLASGANLVPITVAGIGTRDVALALYLGSLGKAPSLALSLSTLVLMLNLVNLGVGALAAAALPGAPRADRSDNSA